MWITLEDSCLNMVEIGSSKYTTQYLQQDLKTRIWLEDWTTSILIPIPKKVSYNCADQRAIALTSRTCKVMLKILQKQIVPMVESVLVDCQVVIRAGRSTVEQVTNLRILCQKYIELD